MSKFSTCAIVAFAALAQAGITLADEAAAPPAQMAAPVVAPMAQPAAPVTQATAAAPAAAPVQGQQMPMMGPGAGYPMMGRPMRGQGMIPPWMAAQQGVPTEGGESTAPTGYPGQMNPMWMQQRQRMMQPPQAVEGSELGSAGYPAQMPPMWMQRRQMMMQSQVPQAPQAEDASAPTMPACRPGMYGNHSDMVSRIEALEQRLMRIEALLQQRSGQ